MKIGIEQVSNGWIVEAGCMRLVFTDGDLLGQDFRRWLMNPHHVEEEYIRKYQKDPMMPRIAEGGAGDIRTDSYRPETGSGRR